MLNRLAQISVMVLIILPMFTTNAGIYKWTDATGKIHYSDQIPTGEKTESLNPVTARPDGSNNTSSELDKREKQFQKRRIERLAKEQAAKNKIAAEKQREKNCKIMRKNLQTYLTKNRVTHVVNGEQVVIPYEERLKKIEKLQKDMEKVCEGF